MRKGSIQALVDCVRATQPLEPEFYVLHAYGALATEFSNMRLPAEGKALILRQFQQNAVESARQLLIETGLPNRRLAVETVEFPFELTCEIAETLDTSICLDTGHVLAGFAGSVGLFDALETMLPRLGEVHLHDSPWQGAEQVKQYGKDHQVLGSGDLELGRLLDFEGPVIFELTLKEALDSLGVVRSLRPDVISA